jgi:hypothetical protein
MLIMLGRMNSASNEYLGVSLTGLSPYIWLLRRLGHNVECCRRNVAGSWTLNKAICIQTTGGIVCGYRDTFASDDLEKLSRSSGHQMA